MVSILNTLGVGSGIDTAAIVDAIVAAERTPRDTALTKKSTKLEAQISGLAQLRAGIDGLFNGLKGRTADGALGARPVSSDASVVTAVAAAGAAALLNSTTLEVRRLAGGQTLVAADLANAAAPVGLGVLTLQPGVMTADNKGGFSFAAGAGAPVSITITAANNTLGGLRDAINAANSGIAASVIDDGSGARLVLKGSTGAASAFTIAASPADGDSGLSRFVYQPGTQAMTSAATAHDAQLVVDGVEVTRGSNTITTLIDGVTLGLKRAATGTAVTIDPSRDIEGIKTAVRDLTATMSAMNALTASLSKAGDTTNAAGALVGDTSVGRLQQALRSLTSTIVMPNAATGVPSRLGDVGIVTARDGTLSVDEKILAAAVTANPDAVNALLVRLTGTGGPLAAIQSDFDAAVSTTGTTDNLARQRTQVATDTAALAARMTDYRAGLVKQYAAMEAAVAASKATQSFLAEQIKAWQTPAA